MRFIFGRSTWHFAFRAPLPSTVFLLVFALPATPPSTRRIAAGGFAPQQPAAAAGLATKSGKARSSEGEPCTPWSGASSDAEKYSSALAEDSKPGGDAIPAGTILPIWLPRISSAKLKVGEVLKSKIAQDVPLAGGAKIHKGTTVLGRVLSTTAPAGPGAVLAIQFDSLLLQGRSIPLRTDLRAMASPLEIDAAQTPTSGPGESDVYDWLTTRQIGDEAVYGLRGPVADGSQIVGESVGDGVLARVRPSSDGNCRGPLAGNSRPQAFWLFSSNACGLYGFPNLKIRHAGRTPPVGEIILESTKGPVEIRGASGALLRVDASGE